MSVNRRLGLGLSLLLLAGCAHTHREPAHVMAESRPTPPPPPPEPATAATPESTPVDRPAPPIGTVMSPGEQQQARTRILADTTAASAALRHCAGRKLLPDQESVVDATRGLLEQTRAALVRNELWRAESLARKARQLAASLDCPG